MKEPKIKRYRLSVSRHFPQYHKRKGEPTYFIEKIMHGVLGVSNLKDENMSKIHTIRGNYDLWSKRMEEVQAGRADIELLFDCDAIYMLNGWEHSKGAKIEKFIAETMGKPIWYEPTFIRSNLYPVVVEALN